MNNLEVSALIAACSSLGAALHESTVGVSGGAAPTVNALSAACAEMLASRSTPTASLYVKKISTRMIRDLAGIAARRKAVPMDVVAAMVQYLDSLRRRRIGMNVDELITSVTVYRVTEAYNDLCSAGSLPPLNEHAVAALHEFLCRYLH